MKQSLKKFLFKSKSILSIEKVENVVKDPKTPIIKKYLIKSSDKFLVSINIIAYPIKKDPTIFTKSVLRNR